MYEGNLESPTGGTKQLFPAALNNSHPVDMKVPRVMNWSFGVQRKLGKATTLEVAYVGSSAANLSRTINSNRLRAGTLQRNPGVNTNALRPYPGYANINMYLTGSNSIYNSMQAQVRQQMKGGSLLNISYTWSRVLTDSSSYSEGPMDSYSFKTERGLATFHRAHVFVFSYIYPLPFWRTGGEWYKVALGGWQIAGGRDLRQPRTERADRSGAGRLGRLIAEVLPD